jgi:hypothetical protein
MESLLRGGPAYLCGLVVCLGNSLANAPVCLTDLLFSALECFVGFYKPNLCANSHSAMLANSHSAMLANSHSAMRDHFATSP